MFSGRRNIFLQNLAAKSTRKVVHFFPISLIGHVDFHLFSPWVAWLSSFQSSLKSIHPQKMGKLRPGFLSPYDMKLRRKNQKKESELNTVNHEFIGIGHLANTERIYLNNARQNVLQEEVNVLINGRVLHYILTTNISTMLLNKQLLVIKLSTGWLSETTYCCSGQV